MAGAECKDAESDENEETMTVSDQPHDEIAATTPTGPAAAPEPADSVQTPNNNPAVPNIAKEEIAPETMTDTDEGTDTKTAKDTTPEDAQPLGDNDEPLLSFGDTIDGNTNESNPGEKNDAITPSENINQEATSSNDFDASSSTQGESINHSSGANDVFGAAPTLDNQSADIATKTAADSEPIFDLLGMTSGENPISNNFPLQQLSSGLADPHHSPTEKKDDSVECAAATQEENSPAIDAASLKPELISECNDATDQGSNQSENDTAIETNEGGSAVDDQEVEKEVGVASVASSSEESTVPVTANLDNKESNDESSAVVEGEDPAKTESVMPSNDNDSLIEEQMNRVYSSTDQGEQEIDQVVSETDFLSTSPPLPIDAAPSSEGAEREETNNDEADGNASTGHDVNEGAEERTEEEEEWLSMGLGLGDALRQIVALTEERDSALSMGQKKENRAAEAEALLVEVQSCLEAELNRRAESESEVRQVRKTLTSYEQRLAAYDTMEDDLETAQANLVTVVSEKSKLELEVHKLRDMRDESEQKGVVLSNRLNEAKKKEANKSTAAGRLGADNENLREELQSTKDELENTSRAKAKLESNMEKLKTKAVERVRRAETVLSEERELNEERKRKMKVFVETKAEELRDAKEGASDMQKELEETRASLRSSRDREEVFQKDLDAARLKYREIQRDMERMKRNSEQLHRMGNNLEQELEKSTSETEEHKKKRMSAKHEIMQMVRTLEAERAVSSKLRESVKFTFTPKALSQQELLTECLRDFQMELERLAAKMGKTLGPSEENELVRAASEGTETSEINGSSRKSRKSRGSKADLDTERLVSNLEQETQHVSKGIMALSGSIERMRSLLDEDIGCMTFLSNVLAGAGEARHERLGDADHQEERNNSDQFV